MSGVEQPTDGKTTDVVQAGLLCGQLVGRRLVLMVIYRELDNPNAFHVEWDLRNAEMTTQELIAADQAMQNLGNNLARMIATRMARDPSADPSAPPPVDADSKLSEGEARTAAKFQADRPFDGQGYG